MREATIKELAGTGGMSTRLIKISSGYFKVHSTTNEPVLNDKNKTSIISRGWHYYEDGHSQFYAIITTGNGTTEQEVWDLLNS